ncbi:MAG: HIT domain-containing protein [candidate division WOR-3 bacterium]
MKQLYAPWRMEYIKECSKQKGKVTDAGHCFICQSQKGDPVKNLVLYTDSYALVMMNRYPYNNGHLMVAPCRHIGAIEKLKPDEYAALFKLIQESVKILKKALRPDGFNIGANLGRYAGAGLPSHFHIHIVPRWIGDVNFFPLLAQTKVICESLSTTYQRLKPFFKNRCLK